MGCFLMGKPGRVWAGEWVHGVVHGWMHDGGVLMQNFLHMLKNQLIFFRQQFFCFVFEQLTRLQV